MNSKLGSRLYTNGVGVAANKKKHSKISQSESPEQYLSGKDSNMSFKFFGKNHKPKYLPHDKNPSKKVSDFKSP